MSDYVREAPWAKHYQAEWENRAADHTLSLWLRLACIAYARHEANGHANFKRGQLTWILGKPPMGDQPFQRVDRTIMHAAVKTAVKHGWLAEGSCTECLIVPGHAVKGGLGDPNKPCSVHERKRQRRRRPELRVVADQ